MEATDRLYRGICGLGRAHRANAMAGHLGAAVIAADFLIRDRPELGQAVRNAIRAEQDRLIQGAETVWYDQQKTEMSIAELFAPLPSMPPCPEGIPLLAEALEPSLDQTRQSGHNVIFTSIAIRALREHPEFATDTVIDGLLDLIHLFKKAGPGRAYLGKQHGWVPGQAVDIGNALENMPYSNLDELAEHVLAEFIRDVHVRRQGFGGFFHLINHAAALVELSRQGFKALALRGLRAHWQHLCLYNALPDLTDELGALNKATCAPWRPTYWQQAESAQWSGWITHRVKTLYGFTTLTEKISNTYIRRDAEDALLYLMA